MRGTFSDIIYSSWEWTKTILFRPFRLKKWILLCFIALLAAEFSGCNTNIKIPYEKPKHEAIQQGEHAGVSSASETLPSSKPPIWLFSFIILLVLLGVVVIILFLWIHSRFSFVFLNSIVKNDASIKIPFLENKIIGNSLFKWNILFLIAAVSTILLTISLLIGAIYFLPLIWKILLSILLVLLFLCIIIVIAIVHVANYDIVIPIMFKNRTGIIKGWKEALKILKRKKSDFILYLLIKISLRILTAIVAGLFTLGIMFALLMQLAVIGGVLYTISFAIPEIIRWGYYVFLILLGIICFMAIIFLISLALLPIPVFFRTYSLKFLSRIDERYNLFQLA